MQFWSSYSHPSATFFLPTSQSLWTHCVTSSPPSTHVPPAFLPKYLKCLQLSLMAPPFAASTAPCLLDSGWMESSASFLQLTSFHFVVPLLWPCPSGSVVFLCCLCVLPAWHVWAVFVSPVCLCWCLLFCLVCFSLIFAWLTAVFLRWRPTLYGKHSFTILS